MEVEPLFQPITTLPLERGAFRPQPGDLVLFTFSFGFKANVVKIIGKSNVLADVMDALLADGLVQRGFSPKVLEDAAKAAESQDAIDAARVDLRHLYTFTVDPIMAQDFDDALSFERTAANTTKVYVHIADVSYFVRERSPLDKEALRRGNSVYVATGVEPMLPPQLSSGVCSLRPGEDRKAVTVEMELNDAGTVLHTRFYRSLIRSDKRLDYEQLERIWKGEEVMHADLARPLEWGRPLAQRLRAVRHDRGSLQIECPEPEFEWNDKGEVVDADPSEELESHWFIESYMVLANEQVASFLEREKVPTVYRVHDIPDPFNLEHLLDVLSSLGLPTPDFNAMAAGPQEIRRVMRETAAWVDRFTPTGRGKQALVQQVLRSQSRAIYHTANIGHFGLASQTYCHFTSPIRRYPDLLVHRGLLAKLDLAPAPTTATLEDWADHCSKTEREAARIELKADDIVLAHLLRRKLDENGWSQTFEGQIVCLTRRGMFVLFDRMFQGYLSTAELPRDYYDLNDLETVLEGRRTGTTLQLADLLPVKVVAIDEARGRVDLTLAGDLKGDGAGAGGSGDDFGSADDRDADDRRAGGHGRGRGRGAGGAPSGPHSGSRKKGAPRTRSSKTTRPPQARRGR